MESKERGFLMRDGKGLTVGGKARGHLPRMLHKDTELPGMALPRALLPRTYLFRGEIFPCWYRSAPPEEENQRVRNPNFSWEKR